MQVSRRHPSNKFRTAARPAAALLNMLSCRRSQITTSLLAPNPFLKRWPSTLLHLRAAQIIINHGCAVPMAAQATPAPSCHGAGRSLCTPHGHYFEGGDALSKRRNDLGTTKMSPYVLMSRERDQEGLRGTISFPPPAILFLEEGRRTDGHGRILSNIGDITVILPRTSSLCLSCALAALARRRPPEPHRTH
jgi:hypothetical protein